MGEEFTFLCDADDAEFGKVRVVRWPEGIVVWVGGQIRWKSWEREGIHARLKRDGWPQRAAFSDAELAAMA